MKNNKRVVAYLLYIILGACLFSLGFAGILDSFWSGMGGAFIGVGIIRMIQMIRYSKDDVYREKMEIEVADERNQFLKNKSWAWAGYLFVLIAAILTIVFKILGQELLSKAASLSVCILVVLYWISYMILRKKY